MKEFCYAGLKNKQWDSEILGYIAQIYQEKGKQELYLKQKPADLDVLVEIAKVQSTEASNEIEGIRTTNTRLKQLVQDKTTPRNRDEKEIAGYPRIIIDRKLGNEDYISHSRHTIFSDKDDYRYINFLNYYDPQINPNGDRDGNWIQLKRSIEQVIADMSSNQNLTQKRLWLSSYYDNIKSRYNLD